MGWNSLSRTLRVSIVVLAAATAILMVGAVFQFPVGDGIAIAVPGADRDAQLLVGMAWWVGLTLYASASEVRTPGGYLLSVSSAPIIASMCLGGPAAAAWITFIGVTEWRELRGSVPWYGTLANHAGLALPAVIGGSVVEIVRASSGDLVLDAVATMVGGLVFILLNDLLIAVLTALRDGRSVRSAAAGLLSLSPGRFSMTVLGWLMAQVSFVSWWATLLFSVPLFAVTRAYEQSSRAAAAEELRAQKEAAEKANREKSLFLATMSHEIRTPLNALVGMSDLLLDGPLEARQRENAETIHAAAGTLLGIVNGILDFSKIEAGKIELEAVPFSPRDLVCGVVTLFTPTARGRGIELEASVDDSVPDRVVGDPTRFRQIVTNLVGNAVKFTEEGSVSVTLGADRATDNRVTLHAAVRDTGVGMSPQTLASLFQPFTQADMSTARRFGGTGLGLAVSRRLIELMGGRITASSVEGAGSCLRFEVPLAVATPDGDADDTPPESEPAAGVAGATVLVAEDNLVNQRVVTRMLEHIGVLVDVVRDGREAVGAVQRKRYDLVLMDCNMPILDGFAATEAIRNLGGPVGRVPIVALTADGFSGDREACLAAGMDGYLSKPITLKSLVDELRRWWPGGGGREDQKTAQTSAVVADDASVPGRPLVDEDRLAEIGSYDPGGADGFMASVFDDFRAVAYESVGAIGRALDDRDCAALEEAAHRLKGAASNAGAAGVAEIARRFMESARAGVIEDDAGDLPMLAAAVDETCEALRKHLARLARREGTGLDEAPNVDEAA